MSNKSKSIEDVYKEKTLHEHILSPQNTDSYIGSILVTLRNVYVVSNNKITREVISYNPGLQKIYDEICVNSRDRTVVDKTCKCIRININKETGTFKIWNDGKGIPIKFHKVSKKYVPEMIFGTLLTSSNYDQKGKITGGKNGYGAKLTNIYSKEFIVETIDSDEGKYYYQKFSNNMYSKEEPIIKNNKNKSYTCITFTPDYEKFNMKSLTNDMYNLLSKRAYDLAACTSSKVKVYLNDEEIKCKKFDDYIKLYYEVKPKLVYNQVNSRWNVGIIFDKDCNFNQVSFVNGICTQNGGTHVSHIVDQLVKKIIENINSQSKYKALKIKRSLITDNISVFVDATIEDPGFDSQTKETLNTKVSDFGTHPDSRCVLSNEFVENVLATGLSDEVIKYAQFKAMDELKKTDGKKTESVINIPKLEDAHWAGTRKSKTTRLFITEGDSAKAFAISGLSVIGREQYGVFPIRGKFLNVRNATAKQILNNEEFKNIKKILGLQQGKKYTDVSKLRYGGIIILTDQDVDGSHIKGLLINMLATFWPQLLTIDGFIQTINTPILKVWKKTDKKKTKPKIFFTLGDYEKWCKNSLNGDISKWNIKYYKGLGTSTEKEAKEIFNEFYEKILTFTEDTTNIDYVKSEISDKDDKDSLDSCSDECSIENVLQESTINSIKLAFDKNFSDNRKIWLSNYDKGCTLEFDKTKKITFDDYVNKDLIHFSNYDNLRSIPSLMDGFKPSQRKIMYACFKRGINASEIKVAQLAGYVAQHTEYHHNEDSLKGTIIGLAQNFVGSNNINLLSPNGNFGYRSMGGKDHASPRYIFTEVDSITSKIFREEDNYVLNYIDEDGTLIEPETYYPIIPTVLINGAQGIGTGFSTFIPLFNPRDIIKCVYNKLKQKENIELKPWYRGFNGTIIPDTDSYKFHSHGKYEIVDGQNIKITELPIDTWISNYKTFLESKIAVNKEDTNAKIEKVLSNSGNNKIEFLVKFKNNELKKFIKSGQDKLIKFLKLSSTISLTNLHLYNNEGKINKYDSIEDIMDEYFKIRLDIYKKRINFMVNKLKNLLDIYEFKIKYIYDVIKKKIKIQGNTREKVIKQLEDNNYPKLHYDHLAKEDLKSYKYITDLQLLSLTTDKIEELEEERDKRKAEYEDYLNTSAHDRWLKELKELEKEYEKWDLKNNIFEEDIVIKKKSSKKSTKEKIKKK